jgi:uncharacterized protein YegP (UPF0339 family)
VNEEWIKGHKLQKYCRDEDCGWRGLPYTPPKQPIRTVKTVDVDEHGGWVFECFDQYGHVVVSSESYARRESCKKAALAEIGRTSGGVYGECVAVIWPPTTKVKGTLIRRKKARK